MMEKIVEISAIVRSLLERPTYIVDHLKNNVIKSHTFSQCQEVFNFYKNLAPEEQSNSKWIDDASDAIKILYDAYEALDHPLIRMNSVSVRELQLVLQTISIADTVILKKLHIQFKEISKKNKEFISMKLSALGKADIREPIQLLQELMDINGGLLYALSQGNDISWVTGKTLNYFDVLLDMDVELKNYASVKEKMKRYISQFRLHSIYLTPDD